MGVIGGIGLAMLAVIGAASSRLIAEEVREWMPWAADRLIKRAVDRLPADQRERYREEWRAHVDDTPGLVGKLYVAVGFLSASRGIARERLNFTDLHEPSNEEILASIRRVIAEDRAIAAGAGSIPSVACGVCHLPLDEHENVLIELREPCPRCGSTARRYTISAMVQAVIRPQKKGDN